MTADNVINFPQQISLQLQKQLDLINGYIAYLDDIKHTVSINDVEKLNRLLEDNEPNLHLIEQAQQRQGSLLESSGYSNDNAGLEQFISEHNLPALREIKDALGARLQQLEKSLLVNDLLIRKNQTRVRQSIRLLSGQETTEAATTYSREGNKQDSHGLQRKLAEV